MTKEEKKAIKYLKNEIERVNKENDFKKIPRAIVCLPLFIDYAETLLNLIEKLKNKVVKRDKELIKLEEYANKNFERKDDVKAKYIPKDKIREKMREYKKLYESGSEDEQTEHIYYDFYIAYEELLEEE